VNLIDFSVRPADFLHEVFYYSDILNKETFCSGDVMLQETLCFRRRSVTETFCRGDVSCGDVLYVRHI
jgi:hypothetical protein